MADFEKVFTETIIPNEGKYSNDKNDSGGETVYGLTRKDDKDWGGWAIVDKYKDKTQLPFTTLQMMAKPYYKIKYWDFMQLDKFPQDLAKRLFTIAVNMGRYWAVSFLQRALNVLNHNGKDYPDLVADGLFGAKTLNAVLASKNLPNVLEAVKGLQAQRYVALTEANQNLEDFTNGWFNRMRNEA